MRKLVLSVFAAGMLLAAGAAQAGTSRVDRNVTGTRPTTGVFTQHVKGRFGKRFQSLYSSTFLDSVESGISGWTLTTTLEDDPAEWLALFGVDTNVAGFVCITVVDPNDPCYHRVFLGPVPTATFLTWLNNQQPVTYWDAAVAVMTVTHEANHYKLYSGDEGRVNACALQQFPGVLSTYFGIYPTITKTVPVKKVVWKKKWVWVRRHGKRVRVRKRVRRVITVYVQKMFANPDYTNLVAASQAVYHSQPPPYSTGTCY